MRNLEIAAIVGAYRAAKEAGKDIKLPAAIAWKRRVNIAKLMEARSLIEQAIQEIHEKYADDEHSVKTDDNGRRVKDEYLEAFTKEQTEIMMQDTDVDIKKVGIEELDGYELSDEDLDTLSFMIEG